MLTEADKPVHIHCLDCWGKYGRICRRRNFLMRYGHGAALLPFAIAGILDRAQSPRLSTALGISAVVWALLVVGYFFVLLIHARVIRCPKCGHFFGPYDACATCGLPRHSRGASGSMIPALD